MSGSDYERLLAIQVIDATELANKNADLIAELRAVLTEILTAPMWVSIGSIHNVARVDVSKELYHRAWSLLEDE